MKVIGVIPARYESVRFPGKPLKLIAQKPLLQWVIEGASTSKKIHQLLVATDHPEIQALAEKLGVECIMTASDLPSGSDRVWQAVQNIPADVVLNIQGDEPLISGEPLDQLISAFEFSDSIEMSTLGRPFKDLDELHSKNTAKIVLNQDKEAIYFSRWPIPYSKSEADGSASATLKHLGVYAFKKSFLQKFCEAGPTDIEIYEGLEQLRALYLGAKIKVVLTDYDSWGVDTPDDVIKVENKLKTLGRI